VYFVFEAINTANVASLIGSIELLSGNDFASWKEKIEVVLGVLDLDYAFRMDDVFVLNYVFCTVLLMYFAQLCCLLQIMPFSWLKWNQREVLISENFLRLIGLKLFIGALCFIYVICTG